MQMMAAPEAFNPECVQTAVQKEVEVSCLGACISSTVDKSNLMKPIDYVTL